MNEKNNLHIWSPELSEEAMSFTQPDIMLKLISTLDDRGWPHLTLITVNRAISRNQIVWGQFFVGTSKQNVQKNPKQGIFYMNTEAPFRFVQVKADFTHTKTEGEDLEYFNKTDFFRYFTYINVNKVFYNDVVAATPIRDLPYKSLSRKILKELRKEASSGLDEKRLNVIGYKLFTNAIGIRAIAYVDPSDGYPIIIPSLLLMAVDHNRLFIPLTALKEDLKKIPNDIKVAVFGANFDMASQVVKGTISGVQTVGDFDFKIVEIEEIYNSSPPLTGQIYPEIKTRPKVTKFTL